MGQVIGRGSIHDDAVPFINLEPDRVERLGPLQTCTATGFPWIPMRSNTS